MERLVRKTTAQQVAEAIELSVITGEFGRGSRLPPERTLAAQLGCCRPTAREGISRCVAKGLLIAIPGLGTFVSSVKLNQSIETTTSLYILEKVPQKRIELVRNFLETRRALLAEVLSLACERCTNDGLRDVIDAFEKMGNAARFSRSLEETAEAEIKAIHVTAELADGYFFWLVLNALREFYRAARADVVAGLKLADFAARSSKICQYLRQRDAEGVRGWVRREYLRTDLSLLNELEARAAAHRRKLGNGARSLALAKPAPADQTPAASQTEPAPPANSDTLPPSAAGPAVSTTDGSRSESAAAVPEEPGAATKPAGRQSEIETTTLRDELDSLATQSTGPPAPLPKRPRCDPAAWHPWFLEWYRRNFQCNPWDNPDEQPPGSFFDDDGDDSMGEG